MSFIKVNVEQARDRRMYFLSPIDTKLEPGKELVLTWHSDIQLKDSAPIANLPLREPGKYRCTYICEQHEGNIKIKFAGPNVCIMTEDFNIQKVDSELYENDFYAYYINREDDPHVCVRAVNEESVSHQLTLQSCAIIIQLIK